MANSIVPKHYKTLRHTSPELGDENVNDCDAMMDGGSWSTVAITTYQCADVHILLILPHPKSFISQIFLKHTLFSLIKVMGNHLPDKQILSEVFCCHIFLSVSCLLSCLRWFFFSAPSSPSLTPSRAMNKPLAPSLLPSLVLAHLHQLNYFPHKDRIWQEGLVLSFSQGRAHRGM